MMRNIALALIVLICAGLAGCREDNKAGMATLLEALTPATDWLRCIFSWLNENSWVVIGILTVALVYFTRQLARTTHLLYRATQDAAKAAGATAKNTQKTDRAFVKLSHMPSGMHADATGMFSVRMEVRNTGETPADIANMVVKPVLRLNSKTLPAKPDYRRAQTAQRSAYLHADEYIYFGQTFSVSEEELAEIQDGTRNFYLIGYVDYVDVFGNSHRAGYARKYDPTIAKGNNLVFDTPAGYNYDRTYGRRRKN